MQVDITLIRDRVLPWIAQALTDQPLTRDALIDNAWSEFEVQLKRQSRGMIKVDQELAKVRAKLASETFVQGAPPAVVEEHRTREASWRNKLEQLVRTRDSLGD